MGRPHYPNDTYTLVKVSEGDDATPLLFEADTGIFWAKHNGRWISRQSLKELTKEVNKTATPVAVHTLYPGAQPSRFNRSQLTGTAPAKNDYGTSRWRTTDNYLIDGWYLILADGDPAADAIRAEMETCSARYEASVEAFTAEWATLMERARTVALTKEQFKELQKAAQLAKTEPQEEQKP